MKTYPQYDDENYPQGTKVEYNPYPKSDKSIILTGKICGIANTDAAIIGKGYIIELDEECKNIIPDYPYSHLMGWQIHLKKI